MQSRRVLVKDDPGVLRNGYKGYTLSLSLSLNFRFCFRELSDLALAGDTKGSGAKTHGRLLMIGRPNRITAARRR